jgi:hypothetical protein
VRLFPVLFSRLFSKLSRIKLSDNTEKVNPNELPNERLDSKSRLGLLKEANNKLGRTAVTNCFEGRLMQTELEYKQVETLMKSDKNPEIVARVEGRLQ